MSPTECYLTHAARTRLPTFVVATPAYLASMSPDPIEIPPGVDLIIAIGGSESERAIPALARTGIPVAYAYSGAERTEFRRNLSRRLAHGTNVRLLDEGEGILIRGFEFVGTSTKSDLPVRFANAISRSNAASGTSVPEQEENQKSGTDASGLSALSATEAARETIATVCVGDNDNGAGTLDIADRMLSSFSEIGKRLQYRRRTLTQEFPPCPMSRPPFAHLHSGGASLPAREALYPLTASTERNLLLENIRTAEAASDAGVLLPVSVADVVFSVPAEEEHSAIDGSGRVIYPCEDFSQWCNAVTELRAELTADGCQFAIEAFSLDHLTGSTPILIGVLVEGIDDDKAAELKEEFCKTIGEKYDHAVQFHVIPYKNVNEVWDLVNALSDEALDVVASLTNL